MNITVQYQLTFPKKSYLQPMFDVNYTNLFIIQCVFKGLLHPSTCLLS